MFDVGLGSTFILLAIYAGGMVVKSWRFDIHATRLLHFFWHLISCAPKIIANFSSRTSKKKPKDEPDKPHKIQNRPP